VWFKVDDGLHDHRKARGIDCAAVGLWTLAGSWCGQHRTDGFVPESVVPRWSRSWKRLAAELVARGLWEPSEQGAERGWVFVNWCDYQPSREETTVPLATLRWRRKQALKKNRSLCEAVVARDRGMCRYCGLRVNWQDRKSGRGGTYDHVDPDGDNTMENVVVACRKCNGRKKDRTPHEAGMLLMPEPGPYLAPDQGPAEPDDPAPSGSDHLETVRVRSDLGRSQVGTGSVEPGLHLSNGNGVHA